MGWWKISGVNLNSGMGDWDATSSDDLQYAMAKTFAYRTSMGLEIGSNFNKHARLNDLFDLFGLYHRLFADEVAGLAIPEEAYSYLQSPDNEADLNDVNGYNFVKKKVFTQYGAWDASSPYSFSFTNPFGAQKLCAEIRPRFDYYPFDSQLHQTLFDFSDSSSLTAQASNDSTRCSISPDGEVLVTNTGSGVGTCSIPIQGPFDLKFKRGIGLEITGDGKNELITVTVQGASYGNRHFVLYADSSDRKKYVIGEPDTHPRDFVGSDLSGNPLYSSKDPKEGSWQDFTWGNVPRVSVSISVPPGDYRIQLHSLKALKEKEDASPLVNPTLSINGQTIVFPVTLYTEDTRPNILEYNGYTGLYNLYTSNYRLLSTEAFSPKTPTIYAGNNDLDMSADTSSPDNSTRAEVRLTVCDDEDNDGIPTDGSFSSTTIYRSETRLNFYDDNAPYVFNPDQAPVDPPSGDVNDDGTVNVLDLILVAQDYGKTSGFNPYCDINKDGIVNLQDLIQVARNYGKGI